MTVIDVALDQVRAGERRAAHRMSLDAADLWRSAAAATCRALRVLALGIVEGLRCLSLRQRLAPLCEAQWKVGA